MKGTTILIIALASLCLLALIGLLIWWYFSRKTESPEPESPVLECPSGFELNSSDKCECIKYSGSEDCFKVDLAGTVYNNYILKLKWNIINEQTTTITSLQAVLFYENDTKNLTVNLPISRTGEKDIIISDLILLEDAVFSVSMAINGILRLNIKPFYFSFKRESIIDPYNSTNISLRNGGNSIWTSLNILFTRFSLFSPDGTKKASHRVSCNQCPRGDKFVFSMPPTGFSLTPSQESLEITIPFRNGDYLEFRFENVRKIAKIVDGITVDSSEFWINFIDDSGNVRQDISDMQIINTVDISWANSDQLVLSAPVVSPVTDMIGDWVYVFNGRERAKIRIKQNQVDINNIDVEYSTVEFHPPIYSLDKWTAQPSGNFYIGQIGTNPVGVDEKIQKVSGRTISYLRARALSPNYFFKSPVQNLPTFFTIWS